MLPVFAASFDNPITPGFCVENSRYKIQYESGHFKVDGVTFGTHQVRYNWEGMINHLLGAIEKAGNDFTEYKEEAAEDALKEWMASFQGWGLLSILAPISKTLPISFSLQYLSEALNVDRLGVYTEEEVFNIVKQMFVHGKEIERLVPDIAIAFDEIMSGGQENEREKMLTIFFDAVGSGKHENELVLTFVVEKKRVNNNLAELSAETLVKSIHSEEEVETLEIPKELLDTVRIKFKDAEWVRDYWRFQSEQEKPKCKRLDQSNEETAAHDQTLKYDMISKDKGSV